MISSDHIEISSTFLHPFTSIISGPTGCGKTSLVKEILLNCTKMISPQPDVIIYCYSRFQPAFSQLQENFNNSTVLLIFKEGLPVLDELDSSKNTLVIIDDLMADVEKNKDMLKLFTVDSHHKNISTIFINQNFFSNGRNMRTISLNSHYLVLFNNPRDSSQIGHLARQIYPKNALHLVDSYEDICKKPYGYLFIDLKQGTDRRVRVRTDILSPFPTIFVPE